MISGVALAFGTIMFLLKPDNWHTAYVSLVFWTALYVTIVKFLHPGVSFS